MPPPYNQHDISSRDSTVDLKIIGNLFRFVILGAVYGIGRQVKKGIKCW